MQNGSDRDSDKENWFGDPIGSVMKRIREKWDTIFCWNWNLESAVSGCENSEKYLIRYLEK